MVDANKGAEWSGFDSHGTLYSTLSLIVTVRDRLRAMTMNDLTQKYLELISGASDESALEKVRVAAVGKKGEVSLKMRELGKMTPEEKKVAGPALNALKNEINSAILAKKEALADVALNERLQAEWIDVSLAGRPRRQGSIHPISQVTDEVIAVFADLGFSVAEGPQIENDWYNFDALNIAPEHP